MNHKVICTLAVVLMTGIAPAQGPLTPPGAPAPLMKTLEQVEPRTPVNAVNTPGDTNAVYVISQPGSYYLTGDVLGVPGQHGIRIDADYVTLDLNGYTLDGVIGSLSGIKTPVQNFSALTIRNGSVRYWGEYGVHVLAGTLILDRVRAEGNTAGGFWQWGNTGVTLNCEAINNGGIGFEVFSTGIMEGCVSRNNGDHGFLFRSYGIHVSNCEATGNAGSGIGPTEDYWVGRVMLVRDSRFSGNAESGLDVRSDIYLENVVSGNHANFGQSGFEMRGNARIKDVEGFGNGFTGIFTLSHEFPNQWETVYITGVQAVSNGQHGVSIKSRRGRIQDSALTGNGTRGLELEAGSNYSIAFRNTGTPSGWWFHTNTFGRGVSAPISAAVSGNAGGAGLGTTDPWVNITQ